MKPLPEVFHRAMCHFSHYWNFARRRATLILFEEKGKRYLAVICADLRGIRWERCFEVQNEVTLYGHEPMEWKPNPVARQED